MDTAKLTAAVETVECENGQKVLVKGLPQPYRSAPELLEALNGLVSDRHGHERGCPCPWCFARAAIAKATGEG